MRTYAVRLLAAILAVASLTGCTKDDPRAQTQFAGVDQIVEAVVLDPQTANGMSIEADHIIWSAKQGWVGDRLLPIPDLATGRELSVIGPRASDLPDAGERVVLFLDYRAPTWVATLVGDPETGAFTGSSKRAEHANEALEVGRSLRPGEPASELTVELIEGARAIADARAGHGDPATAGGLMAEVTPQLSRDNGGPG